MKNIVIKFCRIATPKDGLKMTEDQFYDCIRSLLSNNDDIALDEAKKTFGNSYRFSYRISKTEKWIDPYSRKEYRIEYMQIKRKNARYLPWKSVHANMIMTSKEKGFYKENGLNWADSLLDPTERKIPASVVDLS